MRYLTLPELIELHRRIIQQSGVPLEFVTWDWLNQRLLNPT